MQGTIATVNSTVNLRAQLFLFSKKETAFKIFKKLFVKAKIFENRNLTSTLYFRNFQKKIALKTLNNIENRYLTNILNEYLAFCISARTFNSSCGKTDFGRCLADLLYKFLANIAQLFIGMDFAPMALQNFFYEPIKYLAHLLSLFILKLVHFYYYLDFLSPDFIAWFMRVFGYLPNLYLLWILLHLLKKFFRIIRKKQITREDIFSILKMENMDPILFDYWKLNLINLVLFEILLQESSGEAYRMVINNTIDPAKQFFLRAFVRSYFINKDIFIAYCTLRVLIWRVLPRFLKLFPLFFTFLYNKIKNLKINPF